MHRIELGFYKRAFATHSVPENNLTQYTDPVRAPAAGDLLVAEVLRLGKHTTLEVCNGINQHIFPGDRIIGAFGNRYATDQYEGYVPEGVVEECDLLSIGGVCGLVRSAHTTMAAPTRLRVIGVVCDEQARPLNLHSFGLPGQLAQPHGEVILVVGASMNSGKTTTVGTLARALSRSGAKVAAAKVTGTAACKDGRYFVSCGASPVFDFTDCGLPSTYMLGLDVLTETYRCLLSHCYAARPDYVVIEIADGIFQRETRMLLESELVRASTDHLFFAAGDSLAAACGVSQLLDDRWPLRAVTGMITCSPLMMREAEAATGVACLSIAEMMDGKLLDLLSATKVLAVGASVSHAA